MDKNQNYRLQLTDSLLTEIAILYKNYQAVLTIVKAGGISNNKRKKIINLQSENEIVLQLQNLLNKE